MHTERVAYLYPAATIVSSTPLMIETVLGSCFTVCLWDPFLRFSGMNHYMLPTWNGQGLASPKYGNIAIEKLIHKVEQMGSRKLNIKAKILGGADVIDRQSSIYNIGKRNIEIAINMLQNFNIEIIKKVTGG
jgi:chemotaxis protein CheD